jgi:hypothetical protein
MNKVSKTLLIIAVVFGIALMAFPLSSVLAQDETPPQSEEEEARGMRWLRRPFIKRNIKMRADLANRPLDLEQQYTVLVDRYEDAGYRISDSDDVVNRLETRIEKLIEDGEDPAGMQDILDAFLENMNAVEEAHKELGDLIETHVGFDDEGEVLDEDQALATLRSIAEGLLDIHQLAEDARFSLRWDLKTYRYKNSSLE